MNRRPLSVLALSGLLFLAPYAYAGAPLRDGADRTEVRFKERREILPALARLLAKHFRGVVKTMTDLPLPPRP